MGILVALTAGTMITVRFYYTSNILRDQINSRLSAMADDRQALLVAGLLHVEERIRVLTTRYRLLEVIDRQAGEIHPGEPMQKRRADPRRGRHNTAGLLLSGSRTRPDHADCQRPAAFARPVSSRCQIAVARYAIRR